MHARVVRAREDPAEFLQICWSGEDGQPFRLAPFHVTWLELLRHHDRLVLEAFKGAAKTSVLVAYTLWMLGRNPNLRIKLVAQSDKRARDRLHLIRQHLERNRMLQAVFPKMRLAELGEKSKHRIYLERAAQSKDPSLEALGVLSTVVGARADILVFDDVNDYRNSVMFPEIRESINEKIRSEWIPLLDRGGRVLVAATPYSIRDALAMFRDRKWKVERTVCGGPEDGFSSPWPDNFSSDRLRRLYEELGSIDYDRAYRCVALPTDTMPIRPGWIRYYDNATIGNVDDYICVQGYDLAISQKGDFFAGVTLLYDPKRNFIFVVDAWRGHLSFLEQADKIVELARFLPQRIAVESVGYQGALAQYVSEKSPTPLPIVPVFPRGSKDRRLAEATPLFEQGRVLFHPRLHPRDCDDERAIIRELLSFGAGDHDDFVDALLYAIAALREFTVTKSPATDGVGFEGGDGIAARVSSI